MTAESFASLNAAGSAPRVVLQPNSMSLLGWDFDTHDQAAVIDHIFGQLHKGVGGWVVTPNVDILRLARRNPDFGELIRRASLVLVDGAPLEWAGRLSGQPQVTRTPGSSLMAPIAGEAARRQVPLLLFGGRPGAAQGAAQVLGEMHEGLDVRTYCPPLGFESDPQEWRRGLEAVEESAGGIVMCGLGAPKQEYVMSRLTADVDGTWFLGVGGSIDMTAGYVQRAPSWMQRGGLEWVWRLGNEPRRLFRRYLIDDLPFAVRLLAWAARERAAGTFTQAAAELIPAQQLRALPDAGSWDPAEPPRALLEADAWPPPSAEIPEQYLRGA